MKAATILMTLMALALSQCSCATHRTRNGGGHETQVKATSAKSGRVEREILGLLSEYDKAWLHQDARAFDLLLSDDFIQIDPQGKIHSKAMIVAAASSGEIRLEIGHSEDVTVRIYGHVAITTARWTERGIRKGEGFGGTARDTVTYVKQGGRWRLVLDQATPIKP